MCCNQSSSATLLSPTTPLRNTDNACSRLFRLPPNSGASPAALQVGESSELRRGFGRPDCRLGFNAISVTTDPNLLQKTIGHAHRVCLAYRLRNLMMDGRQHPQDHTS